MKKFLVPFFFLVFLSGFSQDSLKTKRITKYYVPISHYKQMGNTLTAQDSLNFMFRNNDTLVLVDQSFLKSSEKEKIKVEYEPRDSSFLEIYKNVVYGKHLKGVKPTETMRWWKDDVKILFDPTVPQSHRLELMNFAEKISADIDSLTVYEVKDRSNANYFVYYQDTEEGFDHEPRIRGKSGGYFINWNEKQELYRGVLKVNSFIYDQPDNLVNALKYHFFGSLGRFYRTKEVSCKSYFSDCSVNRKVTPLDLELLKYHYSYGVCKGVTLEDFEKLHRTMQEKLKEDPTARLYVVHPE